MLRPSDIAPLVRCYDADAGVSSRLIMSTEQVVFCANGSVTVFFLGIENDQHQSGFVVTLPPSSDAMVDHVGALRDYIARTDRWRCPVTKLLFLSPRRPYGAITASSVAQILGEAIAAAEYFGLPPVIDRGTSGRRGLRRLTGGVSMPTRYSSSAGARPGRCSSNICS